MCLSRRLLKNLSLTEEKRDKGAAVTPHQTAVSKLGPVGRCPLSVLRGSVTRVVK